MGRPVRSKKMAVSESLPDLTAPAGHIQPEMVRIDLMADRILRLNRRALMAGLGAAALGPAMPHNAAAQTRFRLTLQARVGTIDLRLTALANMVAASLAGPRFSLQAAMSSRSPFRTICRCRPVLNWHGIGRRPVAEPLAARAPLSVRDQGNFRGSVAPCGHLAVRPAAAGRRSGAAFAGAGVDRRRERARHGRPRRSVSDRRLAAPPGRHRDRARDRSKGDERQFTRSMG